LVGGGAEERRGKKSVCTSSVIADLEVLHRTEGAQLFVDVLDEVVEVLARLLRQLLYGTQVVGCRPLGRHRGHVHVRQQNGLADGRAIVQSGALVAMAASTNFEEERAVDP
jgi:hypothetical protein